MGNVERRLFTHVIFELQSYYADMCIRHQFKLLCYMELSVGQQGNRGSSVKYMCEVHMLRWMCGVTRKGIIKSREFGGNSSEKENQQISLEMVRSCTKKTKSNPVGDVLEGTYDLKLEGKA